MWKACVALCVYGWTVAMASTPVIYPREVIPNDPHWEYPLKLLELGLKKSGNSYTLRPSAKSAILQGRAILALERGDPGLTLLWTMTDTERESKLLPIRIPIYKGLIGWRIPLVRRDRADLFKDVKSLTALRSFSAGQGHDWPDTAILKSNGLQVETSSRYASLFDMLAVGRFDYFPRSVAEIWSELETTTTQGLTADPHVVLHYPTAFYFFVAKGNTRLASDLERGLNLAIADGSFDALFYRYHGEIIARANLKGRTVIALTNPTLPPQTPLHRAELWLNPLQH